VPLSGAAMLRLYEKDGWVVLHRKGSHVKVGRGLLRETIPMHDEVDRGLERKLLKRLRQTRPLREGS
jgi:predicted RNA binding protein YcfA (HicA-like mRNA interferase family)